MAIDARVKYTKMIIEKTFIDLLKTKPLNKITVKEICDGAEINRSTFYKYYEDVFDLFDKIENELNDEFHEMIESVKTKGIRESLIEILNKIKNNIEKYETIIKGRGYDYLKEKIFVNYYSEIAKINDLGLPDVPEEKHMLILYFISFGSGGILSYWIQNGMKESAEEIAVLIENAIDNTLNMFAEK